MNFTLYGTEGCHLCDEAGALIMSVATGMQVAVWQEDIADSEALFSRYGTRIPVLKNESRGTELDWPFDAAQLREFLGDVQSD